jgi:hypothetical protein
LAPRPFRVPRFGEGRAILLRIMGLRSAASGSTPNADPVEDTPRRSFGLRLSPRPPDCRSEEGPVAGPRRRNEGDDTVQ